MDDSGIAEILCQDVASGIQPQRRRLVLNLRENDGIYGVV